MFLSRGYGPNRVAATPCYADRTMPDSVPAYASRQPVELPTPVTAGVTAAPGMRDAALALAHELGLPFAEDEDSGDVALLFVLTSERLELRDRREGRMKPVYADFSGLRHAPLTHRQPLVRALGRRTRIVVDATAGLGQDAARLAAAGYRVTAIERHAAVAALLRDGLRRAQRDPLLAHVLGERLTVLHGDARSLLPGLRPRPDAVYLDPMFPPKRRASAAARKELRLLRALVGTDADAHELLEVGLRCAPRVVVKRPDGALPLTPPNPAVNFAGKLVRYDVYLARCT